MNFIKQIERLQLLNKLIQEQNTGSPEELAKRLNVSRRQLYNYLESLKDIGIEICYSRKYDTFYFGDRKKLKINFKFEVMEPDESNNIIGGKRSKQSACFFFARSGFNLAI